MGGLLLDTCVEKGEERIERWVGGWVGGRRRTWGGQVEFEGGEEDGEDGLELDVGELLAQASVQTLCMGGWVGGWVD